MVRDNDIVIIFHSIHRVMKAEKILKQGKAEILLIPVPRQLSADCGLAIRYAPDQQAAVARLLAAADLLPAESYHKTGVDYVPQTP